MPGKAAKVVISETQQSVLEEIAVSRTAAVRLVQRAKIILLAFGGMLNEEISEEVDLNPDQVGCWRRRWQRSFEALIAVQCNEGRTAMRKAVEKLLADLPRKGGKPTFTAEQQAAIIAIACEEPEDSDRPISHWSQREIAEEAQKRDIVESISPRQVGRFLKSGRLASASRQVLAESQAR
jgi:putative transposase